MITDLLREPMFSDTLSMREAKNIKYEYERLVTLLAPEIAVRQGMNMFPPGDPRTMARIALGQLIEDADVSEICEMQGALK